MTWAMVEAYGIEPRTGAPAPCFAGVFDAVRDALRRNDGTGRDRLAWIGDAVAQLDATFLRASEQDVAQGAQARRVDEAFTTIRCVLARAGAARLLEQKWGLPAPGNWLPGVAIERIAALLEGTIFPGLGHIPLPGNPGIDHPSGRVACSILIQGLPGRLRRREFAKSLRCVEGLLTRDARTAPGGDAGDVLPQIRRLARRLLEMRYVLMAMRRRRVRGRPRRRLGKAIRRQTGRLARAVGQASLLE